MTTSNITLTGSSGSTVLSNIFIDHFMKDANDAQIKIYLYLLRVVGAKQATGISEIAEQFNHTENDVIRSLKYWEEKKLLSLSYDAKQNIIGIALLHAPEMTTASKETEFFKETPVSTKESGASSESESTPSNEETSEGKLATDSPYHSNLISKFSMDYAKEKASYSLEDLKRLKENSEACMLLVVAEQYFGRPLNPQEIRTLLFIYDRLAFCFDLEDYLLQFCLERDQKNIHYIESVAISWYESGINTVKKAKEMAKRYDKRYDKTAYSIMKYLGSSKEPTTFELDYIQKWNFVFHFPLSIIEEACKRAVMATDKHRFEYADSILKSWYDQNVRSKEDIARLDREYEASKRAALGKTSAKTQSQPKNSGSEFCNFTQNEYDFEALEKALTAR